MGDWISNVAESVRGFLATALSSEPEGPPICRGGICPLEDPSSQNGQARGDVLFPRAEVASTYADPNDLSLPQVIEGHGYLSGSDTEGCFTDRQCCPQGELN